MLRELHSPSGQAVDIGSPGTKTQVIPRDPEKKAFSLALYSESLVTYPGKLRWDRGKEGDTALRLRVTTEPH